MLELKNFSYSIFENNGGKRKEKAILTNISLTVNDGEMIVVTGPNGSGKSTLAKLIMGIINPTSGKILFNGKDITNLKVFERAKLGISFAFQQPVKFKGITVRDLISMASGEDVGIDKACGYLSSVGLCARDYVDRVVDGSLSGGELKRIEIALCEARKSVLTIFDEPEAGIDLWSFTSLIKVFERLHQRNKDSASVIISHQERLIEKADRVVLLEAGKIKKIGTPSEVLDDFAASTACNRLKEDE